MRTVCGVWYRIFHIFESKHIPSKESLRSVTRPRQGTSVSLGVGPATASFPHVPAIAQNSGQPQLPCQRDQGARSRAAGREGAGIHWKGCCVVFLFCFYKEILKALHKPRKYLLILCSYSTGELWILHPGSRQMRTGPQQHCSHTPAAGWMGQKLLPKQNPLLLMPEQSRHRNKSWQRAL